VFKLIKKNEAEIFVRSSDSGALMELSEHFTFYVEGYKFMPTFRNKMWDGKCRLFNLRSHTLPYGLIGEVAKFAKERNYNIEYDDSLRTNLPTRAEVIAYISSLKLQARGSDITPHDYQIEAVIQSLTSGRTLVLSPTGSGKSLIIYMLLRWYIDHETQKALVVVPTTSLVEQLFNDFADYSSADSDFDSSTLVHRIYSGKEKDVPSARITITTWQSAITCTESWFKKYGMIIGDEAHQFKAKSLNTIMNTLTNASYRIGTTGTLDGSKCNERVLIGHFGPIFKVTTTKALMENKTLADLSIHCIVLDYADEIKKAVSKLDYASEIDVIITHAARNRFIVNLARGLKGNTLVIFNYVVKHGKPLYAALVEAEPSRKIYYVSGETDTDIRESVRGEVEKEQNAIIVASSATFSTGINIRNLHNIIFAAPTKSQIKILQSIGRGLRLSDNGQSTTVYDISDNFSWKKKKNFSLKHGAERVAIYDKEGFKYKIYTVGI
jgi:superfamily II DNA or RNA helicase